MSPPGRFIQQNRQHRQSLNLIAPKHEPAPLLVLASEGVVKEEPLELSDTIEGSGIRLQAMTAWVS